MNKNSSENFPHIEDIISVLLSADRPMSALDIRGKLKFLPKLEINRTLYKNPSIFCEEPGRPPVWNLIRTPDDPADGNESGEEDDPTEVWIDLLNCAEIASKIDQYDHVKVRGYCNDIYRGIRPENTIVLPAEGGLLQIKLICDLAATLSENKKKCIVLCSRNKLYENISLIFPTVVICKKFTEARMYL